MFRQIQSAHPFAGDGLLQVRLCNPSPQIPSFGIHAPHPLHPPSIGSPMMSLQSGGLVAQLEHTGSGVLQPGLLYAMIGVTGCAHEAVRLRGQYP